MSIDEFHVPRTESASVIVSYALRERIIPSERKSESYRRSWEADDRKEHWRKVAATLVSRVGPFVTVLCTRQETVRNAELICA